MKRLGYIYLRRYRLYALCGALLLSLIVIVMIWDGHYLHLSNTIITQAQPVTSYYSTNADLTESISNPQFRIFLPNDWRQVTANVVPHAIASWHGTQTKDADRQLDIYIGTVPTGLAVNRLLPVQAAGDHLNVIGSVSDNCVSFTNPTAAEKAAGVTQAKWADISFLCDIANYERDVVAIGSTQGVNTVILTGQVEGAQHVLLVYTDNSANPDYATFQAIARSFVLH